MNTTLEVQEVSCIRQGKTIFAPVSFTLKAGEILLVEGPNGAGKSSLLRILAGLATPASGNVRFGNEIIHDSLTHYSEHLHYLGHTNGIRLGLTVAENLILAGQFAEQPLDQMDAVLTELQIHHLKHAATAFLSAGQKRRTALSRILLLPRKLWILDEPFTSLDASSQHHLTLKLKAHLAGGGLCIMTSHQPLTLDMPIQSLRLNPC